MADEKFCLNKERSSFSLAYQMGRKPAEDKLYLGAAKSIRQSPRHR